jgi:hypothetical protein
MCQEVGNADIKVVIGAVIRGLVSGNQTGFRLPGWVRDVETAEPRPVGVP